MTVTIHNSSEKPFDIFISYTSEDIAFVNRLKESLESRGIKVWPDKEKSRRGDSVAESLDKGIDMSKAMALVITPHSLASNWVREEYYRARSLVNEDRLYLIPILLQKTSLPGFLKGGQYIDFSDGSSYERNVDRLIWPGITGKRVCIAWINPSVTSHHWQCDPTLDVLVRTLGVKMITIALDLQVDWQHAINRSGWSDDLLRPSRHIAFVNIFEDDQKPYARCNSPTEYTEFIFRLRDITRGTQDELVFILYHKSCAFEANHNISAPVVERLRHYLVINYDHPSEVVARELDRAWRKAQNLLISTEMSAPRAETVILSDILVYEIYPDTKYVRKLKLTFDTNCFVREDDIGVYFEASNLVAQFGGKRAGEALKFSCFFAASSDEDRLILVPTGYNGVWLDHSSVMKTEITYGVDKISVRLEFLRA